jgi:mannose-6-phosphate isomerase
MELYPLKFQPIFKETIWGGQKLATKLNKNLEGKTNVGESWEISGVENNLSVVANGNLAGNDLQEMIEVYMGDLVGDKVYEKFGQEFPLLIKFIDANDDLSIQVHPDDMMAAERHHAFGKTEMWYALDGGDDVQLITGFKETVTRELFLEKLNANTLPEILNYETVQKGDVFFVPAGRVHAICKNNLVAEIQQTSDITYRVYDYDRRDKNGKGRDLHLDLSLDVMDYQKVENPKTAYTLQANTPTELVTCDYFTTNCIELNAKVLRDYFKLDSFVIFIGLEGTTNIQYDGETSIELKTGETILLPASIPTVVLVPHNETSKLLEIYIK